MPHEVSLTTDFIHRIKSLRQAVLRAKCSISLVVRIQNIGQFREFMDSAERFSEFWQRAARPRGYKTFSMLKSVEHEILNAHKYKKYQEIRLLLGSDKPRMLFSRS